MKITQLKLNNAVMFDGGQITYFSSDKLEMDYDQKTMLVTIVNHRDTVQTPLTNVVWMRPAPVEKK